MIAAQLCTERASAAPRGTRKVRWPAMVDAGVDALVVAFAAWTLAYEVTLAAQRSIRWLGWPWLVLTALGVVAAARRARLDCSTASEDGERGEPASAPLRASAGVRTVIAAAVLVITVLARGRLGLVPLAVVAVVILGEQLVALWRRPPVPCGLADVRAPRSIEHILAGIGSLGLAVLGSLLVRPDADDAYYVNRATWIAHHGVPVTGDTMYGADRLPSATDAGLPTPSIEALQGSLAYALHLNAATVAYLLWVPALALVLGWTMWRLVRAWAPRRRLLAFAVAVLFLLASGATITGGYSVGRLWQGKVAALAVLLPLIWVYLSRLARYGGIVSQVLLACAGIAFVGLTTTSALLAPIVGGAALVAAVALRSRSMVIGAALLLAAPLANGIAEKFGPAAVNQGGSGAAPAVQVFALAFGSGAMALLAVLALALAPRLVDGPARAVAASIALVTLATFLPGVLGIANGFTGAGPVIWRLAVAAPVPVLVGLLTTVEVPRLPAVVTGTTGIAAMLAVAVFSGTWLWTGGRLTSHPAWKVDQQALADVRAAQRLSVPPGRWLLPEASMSILAISEAGPYPVVPRAYYLTSPHGARYQVRDRRVLLRLVRDRPVAAARVSRALRALDVSLACVPAVASNAPRILEEVVGTPLRTVGTMRCHVERVAQAPSM